jgi:hypothetical protein
MVEIRTTLEAFDKLVKKSKAPIFESKEAVITSVKGMIVMARKGKATKRFRRSLPLTGLGYSGVASYEWGGICTKPRKKQKHKKK